MSDSEVFGTYGEPFDGPPGPAIVHPRATVVVHFHPDQWRDHCTVYRQEIKLTPGSGYAQAIDRLLNHDDAGHPIDVDRRPRGGACTEDHYRVR